MAKVAFVELGVRHGWAAVAGYVEPDRALAEAAWHTLQIGFGPNLNDR